MNLVLDRLFVLYHHFFFLFILRYFHTMSFIHVLPVELWQDHILSFLSLEDLWRWQMLSKFCYALGTEDIVIQRLVMQEDSNVIHRKIEKLQNGTESMAVKRNRLYRFFSRHNPVLLEWHHDVFCLSTNVIVQQELLHAAQNMSPFMLGMTRKVLMAVPETQSALSAIVRLNQGTLFKSLLGHIETRDKNALSYPLLEVACNYGHVGLVAFILAKSGINPADENSRCLVRACSSGHLSVVKCLIEDGRSDPMVKNGAPLLVACANGHLSIVKYLSARMKLHGSRHLANLAIYAATTHGHVQIVEHLHSIDHGHAASHDKSSDLIQAKIVQQQQHGLLGLLTWFIIYGHLHIMLWFFSEIMRAVMKRRHVIKIYQ